MLPYAVTFSALWALLPSAAEPGNAGVEFPDDFDVRIPTTSSLDSSSSRQGPFLAREEADAPPTAASRALQFDGPAKHYVYEEYAKVLTFIENLGKTYPDFVEVWDGLEVYPHIADKSNWAMCGPSVCRVLIMRVTAEKTLRPERPEIFFSGELHGDEKIGPQVVYELAYELARAAAATEGGPTQLLPSDSPEQRRAKELRWMVDNRSLIMIAMSNPHGYFHTARVENGMDPNRDFAYLQANCMQTVTARVINEVFREHLFRSMITFHGGTRILSYEWGSKNHVNAAKKSTEAPDDSAQVQVATALQRASGKQGGRWFYPKGTMTDTVGRVYVRRIVPDTVGGWTYGGSSCRGGRVRIFPTP